MFLLEDKSRHRPSILSAIFFPISQTKRSAREMNFFVIIEPSKEFRRDCDNKWRCNELFIAVRVCQSSSLVYKNVTFLSACLAS